MSTPLPELLTADLLSSVGLLPLFPGGAALAGQSWAEQVLAVSSQRFRSDTRQHISQVVDDQVVLDTRGTTILLLPETPVTAVTAVTVNGLPVTGPFEFSRAGMLARGEWAPWQPTDADWPYLSEYDREHRLRFPDGYGRVLVTYTHGHPVVPADIQHAVAEDAIALANTQNVYSALTLGRGAVFTYRAGGTTAAWDATVAKYRVRLQ